MPDIFVEVAPPAVIHATVNAPLTTPSFNLPQNFDLRKYGVLVDGVTDNTAAIALALAAASAAGGGIVFAPAGLIRFISIDIPANVTLQCAGKGATIFSRFDTAGTVPTGLQFSIRLMGNKAQLRDCSVRGRYRYDTTPAVPTYDSAVCVYGDNVTDCTVENVEAYDSHIGFWLGGIIGNAAFSFGGQDRNTFKNCTAFKTYDNGFGLAGKNRTTGINSYNRIINGRQYLSYTQGGMEIRYNQFAQVDIFSAKDNTAVGSGMAIRFEECDQAEANGVTADNCDQAIQFVHDSVGCHVRGLRAKGGTYGLQMNFSDDCSIDGFSIEDTGRDGMVVGWLDGQAGTWARRNSRCKLSNGSILRAGQAATGRGIYVFGTSVDAEVVGNGSNLQLDNIFIGDCQSHGLDIEAGLDYTARNVVVKDCGTGQGAAGCGAFITNPTVGGVPNLAYPTGTIESLMAIKTGAFMPRVINDQTGAAKRRLTKLGRVVTIGAFTQMPDNPYLGGDDSGMFIQFISNLARGLVLSQHTSGLSSPRLMLVNAADGTGVAMRENAGVLDFFTGSVPDVLTGVLRMQMTSSALLGANAQSLGTVGIPWLQAVLKRLIGAGTAHAPGDYALSAGWGNTATVSSVAARDTGGRVSITCNGAGIAANPTVTLTYKDGAWGVAPTCVPQRADINAPSAAQFVPTSDTLTTFVLTFLGTPVAGTVYTFSFGVLGK